MKFLCRVCCLFLIACSTAFPVAFADDRPNILWITSEDNGQELGCYGDKYADTPNIDGLAARGVRYRNCWSNAPVCAPARTTLISGLYPPSTGAENMRSVTRLPEAFRFYPEYLRDAGYYCTNNSKEDYNLKPHAQVWDESSRQAHWKNRGANQPFFAIFNITISHESQIRKRPHTPVHDPAGARVPAYHPDTPEVRRDWAQYYDKVTEMDAEVGRRLQELTDAGLADDTIVFYYGDHGSGMPRSKRWPFNSGLEVPLVVHVPAKFQKLAPSGYAAGAALDRLVSFVDLPATVLSIAGIRPPDHFQGFAFMGQHTTVPQPYIYGFRGRMDERYDLVRSVRDKRFVYIRNYMPQRIYGQYIEYMFQTPTTAVWKQLYDAGKLSPPQTYFWEPKPAEELYDLQTDPDEVVNLAASAEHQEILQRLRSAQQQQVLRIRDVGFLPEAEVHARVGQDTPYELGHDAARYPLERILRTAELATICGGRGGANADPQAVTALIDALSDDDSGVRYWAATGLLIRGAAAVQRAANPLRAAMTDQESSPNVRIIAAECLARYGVEDDLKPALSTLLHTADLRHSNVYVAMAALNSLDELDERAATVKSAIAALPRQDRSIDRRMRAYVGNLIDKTVADLP